MTSLLTKLLLALSLVANPVAVLASDFHDVGVNANRTMEEIKCDPMELQENPGQPTQHDSENCEMSCCEDSECSMQGICIIQHNSDFVTQKALRFNHPLENRGRDAFITVVPDREQPPENPPPIHI